MTLHVDVRKPDGAEDVVILDLVGKLTAGFGDQVLRESLDELLGEGWRKIVLNLMGVTFMDSAGLGELVAGLKTARHVGADLKVVAAGEGRVRSTMTLSRLLPLFEVVETEDAALRSFASSSG